MLSLTPSTLLATAAALASTTSASILWDGRFNSTTLSDIEAWSWSNQAGPYQYYIHGSSDISSYVNIDSAFKNPSDTSSADGVKITLDDTSYWNGQTMRRTELIPQTSAAINAGKVYYHFSMKHATTNAPNTQTEHQIAFFESHFTEMKSGLLSGASGSSNALYWMVNSESQWNISDWTAGVWHNIAYGIDFDAGTVEFYHSTDSAELALVAGPVSVSASSNGADWHLGALRLAPSDSSVGAGAEDFYFSGVYVEGGELTTAVAGPEAGSSAGAASSTAAVSTSSSAVAVASTSSAVSTAAAVVTTSSSAAAAPTTLQTVVKSSSAASMAIPITTASASSASAEAATTSVAASTSEAAAAATTSADSDADCAVEYVYV